MHVKGDLKTHYLHKMADKMVDEAMVTNVREVHFSIIECKFYF